MEGITRVCNGELGPRADGVDLENRPARRFNRRTSRCGKSTLCDYGLMDSPTGRVLFAESPCANAVTDARASSQEWNSFQSFN